MTIILGQEAQPAAPSASKAHLYVGTDGRLRAVLPSGAVHVFSDLARSENLLVNGGLWWAQRQDAGTLTTYSNTTGRSYAADRFGITNENASVQYQRIDAMAAPETGLSARHYGKLVKITSTGKIILSQAIEAAHMAPYRGRRVALQFKAKNIVGSHTLRLALLQLAAAGTADTIPATFVSAFGAVGTDPTWGTNLAAITPALAYGAGAVSGAGVSCVLTAAWQRFGGVFLVPSDCKNLVAVVFTNGQPAASDAVGVAELGLYDGDEERDWLPGLVEHELQRCLRYYHKTFDLDVGPIKNIGSVTGAVRYPAPIVATGTERSPNWDHPVRMRAVPTATTFNPSAANAQVRDAQAAGDCSVTAVQSLTDRCYALQCTGNATTAIGNNLSVHVTFDAEL